jgi:dihydrofolate synthase/folylpolyglutamate synthase
MQSYEASLAWLYALQPRGIRLELDRMRQACARRGHPERKLRVVHVAGTNGKGSTSAMIAAIARASGQHVGLYTSPHLHSFRERIQIDGVPLSKEEVVTRVQAIRAMLEEPGAPELTFFEVTTLLAFEAFAERDLDLVVLEVGLGGRLDATNVIAHPALTVITRIDVDHQSYLGDSRGQIAGEKAGILKVNVPVIHAADEGWSGPPEEAATPVIAQTAARLGARVEVLGLDVIARDATQVTRASRTIENLAPSLLGPFQRTNVGLAVGAAMLLGYEDEAIRAGVANVVWPGRLELLKGTPSVLLDAAHNPNGAEGLAAFLRTRAPEKRVLLFGAMADKDWRAMLQTLAQVVDAFVFVAPEMKRAERPERFLEVHAGQAAASIEEGLALARLEAGEDGLVVACGSIFVLSEVRAILLGVEHEPPIPM